MDAVVDDSVLEMGKNDLQKSKDRPPCRPFFQCWLESQTSNARKELGARLKCANGGGPENHMIRYVGCAWESSAGIYSSRVLTKSLACFDSNFSDVYILCGPAIAAISCGQPSSSYSPPVSLHTAACISAHQLTGLVPDSAQPVSKRLPEGSLNSSN